MPSSVGPNILGDSNLVFNYDTGDLTNSYKGKPTTNLLSLYFNTGYELNGGEFSQYANLAPIFDTYGTGSNVPYSLSLDMKINSPGAQVLVYMQNGSFTKYGFVSQWVNATSEYQRFTFNNLNANISTPTETLAMLAFYTIYGSGVLPSIKNVQVELGTAATPYVSGSRSVSASLFDISGYRKTVNSISASYNSAGQLFFSGSNYLIADPLSRLITHTVETLFRPTAYANNYGCVVSDQYGTVLNYKLGYEGNTTMAGGFYDGGWRLTPTISTTLNVWHHIVYTYDGSSLTIYKNGLLGGTNLYTGSPNTNGLSLRIGRRWDNPDYFAGDIPIVRIYNRALTVDEITNNFNELKTRFNFS
jgi:hypothetical protein